MSFNASDINALIEAACSNVVANGNNNNLWSTLVTIASVLLIPGSHFVVQLYDRWKYGPSGNTPAAKATV
jgi:hypothetical protein